MLFRDFTEQHYLPFARVNKRSWQTDERYLRRHILPYLGDCPLEDISGAVLERWIDDLEHAGLAYGSRYRVFWTAKYVLNCAVRWGVLASDAAFRACLMKARVYRKPELLDAQAARELLALLQQYSGRASAQAIHLLLLTGANKSEILYARWEDVDVEHGVLTTNKTYSGRSRLIPLSSEALKLIHNLPRRENVPWLFASSTGRRVTSLVYTWNMLRCGIGRPHLRLQDLRHTFVSFLTDMGAGPDDVRRIMGHYMPATLAMVCHNHTAMNKGERS